MAIQSEGSVVVTGASSGIGAAIALELAHRGYTVACLSRRGSIPESDKSEVARRLVGYSCDVTNEAVVARTVQHIAEAMGPVTGLVNCAGSYEECASAELSLAELRRTIDVDFLGAFTLCRELYPHMRVRGGLMVNLGSFYDRLGVPQHLGYAAAKAALASMARTLAVEWARDGIAVLTLAPGYVHTEFNRAYFEDTSRRQAVERRIPVRRLGDAAEIARVVAGLFDMKSSFLTGTTIYVDGGQSISL